MAKVKSHDPMFVVPIILVNLSVFFIITSNDHFARPTMHYYMIKNDKNTRKNLPQRHFSEIDPKSYSTCCNRNLQTKDT